MWKNSTRLFLALRQNYKTDQFWQISAAQKRFVRRQPKEEEQEMFCFQCEQTKNRKGCVTIGVCGKTPEVAKLQDLLVFASKGLAAFAHRATLAGVKLDQSVPDLLTDSLFSTLTNVNFDPARFGPLIQQTLKTRDQLKVQYEEACKAQGRTPSSVDTPATVYQLPEGKEDDLETLTTEGEKVGVLSSTEKYGASLHGVREMVVYGLKGTAAYYAHANQLGQRDPKVENDLYQMLSFLESGDEEARMDLGQNLALALRVGGTNLRVMELLDQGHTHNFGIPSPSTVPDYPKQGKCILVSGHDMSDISRILEMTEGRGVNVFTHGEMLPAHGYPELRKYKHLAGHFGGGWQMQQFEFPRFPGPIVITTNCIIEPRKSYKDRVYTLNSVGWPGLDHVSTKSPESFEPIIQQALSMPGFSAEDEEKADKKTLTVGFGHDAILGHAGTVIDAVKSGALKRVFLVGGCDGSENKRNYFTQLVDQLPEDTLILTMGCAKYRFNRLRDFGTLGDSGIPRLLDMGQCNDSFGAVKVAMALAEAFDTDVNGLPLSLCVSWFEQKAVAVLLTLLHLGVHNVHLGPVVPAFLTEEVLEILQDKFKLVPIALKRARDPAEDIKTMLGGD